MSAATQSVTPKSLIKWTGDINTITSLGIAALMCLFSIITSSPHARFAIVTLALCQLLLKAQRIMYFFDPTWEPSATWCYWSPLIQLGDILGKTCITYWSLQAMMLAGGIPWMGTVLLTTFIIFAMILNDFLRNNVKQLDNKDHMTHRLFDALRTSSAMRFYGMVLFVGVMLMPCVLLSTHWITGLSMTMLLQQHAVLICLCLMACTCLCALLIRFSKNTKESCIKLCLLDTWANAGLVVQATIITYLSSQYLIYMVVGALCMAVAQWLGSSYYLQVYFQPPTPSTANETSKPIHWFDGMHVLSLWVPSCMSALGTCISKCATTLAFMRSKNIPSTLSITLTICLGLIYFIRDLSNWIYNHLCLNHPDACFKVETDPGATREKVSASTTSSPKVVANTNENNNLSNNRTPQGDTSKLRVKQTN